jgi:hypothetical protein
MEELDPATTSAETMEERKQEERRIVLEEYARGQEWRIKLAQKKLAVVGALERIRKAGKNTEQKYDFVREADVNDAVSDAMVAAKLGFCIRNPKIIDKAERKVSTGATWILYTVAAEIGLQDAETGYTEWTEWIGQGYDPGDKGIYKALTGMVKYFLLKTFLIATGDDPENDGGNPPKTTPPPAGKKLPPAGNKPPTTPPAKTTPPPAQKPATTDEPLKMPPIPPAAKPILEALDDYYRQQETDNFKFNPAKLRIVIIQQFKKWPTLDKSAAAIKQKIQFIDVADEEVAS